LEELFNAMFKGKRKFSDFAQLAVDESCERKVFTTQGRSREIAHPNDKLKGCHEFIRLFLLDFLPVETDVVFSYRKGVSAYDAVVRHAQNRHFLATDVANFFPSLTKRRVQLTLESGGAQSPISDLPSWLDRIATLVCLDGALPVGFSTSPAISNAALRPFDRALKAECQARGLTYTRYSDDLLVSGQEGGDVAVAEQLVQEVLQRSMGGELQLNPAKSRLLHRGSKVKLLGMVLLPNGAVSIDASVKSQIEVLVHFYLRDRSKFAAMGQGDENRAEARLSGLLNYANSVDQGYLDKLRRKFGAAVIDLFIHRSFG
jgi:RNA-directed DNA polymerase